jgi:triacylglycerol esterase/lipase EstA (alpha/beta hydrolase family)
MRAVVIASLMLLAACRFHGLDRDVERLNALGEVSGRVTVAGDDEGPVVVALIAVPSRPWEATRLVRALVLEGGGGSFRFSVERGRYRVIAFEDADRDDRVSEGERSAASDLMQIGRREFVDDVRLHIAAVSNVPLMGKRLVDERRFVVGEIAELDHERFGAAAGEMSAWRPREMVARHQPGLYFLEPYDPDKLPVLFIHGLGGYGQQFAPLIDALDRERFQPWVFTYPSGMRVGHSAELLEAAIREAYVDTDAAHLCVVAHSVGGLVTRHALGHHLRERDESLVRGLTTIGSPWSGLSAVAAGVRMAPEVVPAWYDLVPDQGFVRSLYRVPLPPRMPFVLLFSYREGSVGDGVVPVSSQLRREAQEEATTMRGVEATHPGALEHPVVLRYVRRSLALCAANEPPAAEEPAE